MKIFYKLIIIVITGSVILVSVFLSSYNTTKTSKIVNLQKAKLSNLDRLYYDLGYPNTRLNSGYINFPGDSTDYIYFCNRSTTKKISIFTINGVLKYEIPLNALDFYITEIRDFCIHSLDTIFVLSARTNKLFVLNRTGKIWRHIDLNKHLTFKEKKLKYELLPSFHQNFYYNGSLYFGVVLMDYENPYTEYLDVKAHYQKISSDSPYLCRIDNIFTDTVSIKYGLSGFLKSFYDSTFYLSDFRYYYPVNNKLLVTSVYSNIIFEVDPNNLEIVKQHELHSNYSKIRIIPETIIEAIRNKDGLNKGFQQQGFMDNLSYNSESGLYFIRVRHDLDSIQIENDNHPFSIMVLDKNLNPIGESNIIDKRYICRPIFVLDKILIPDNSPLDDNYERTKFKYDVYSF